MMFFHIDEAGSHKAGIKYQGKTRAQNIWIAMPINTSTKYFCCSFYTTADNNPVSKCWNVYRCLSLLLLPFIDSTTALKSALIVLLSCQQTPWSYEHEVLILVGKFLFCSRLILDTQRQQVSLSLVPRGAILKLRIMTKELQIYPEKLKANTEKINNSTESEIEDSYKQFSPLFCHHEFMFCSVMVKISL